VEESRERTLRTNDDERIDAYFQRTLSSQASPHLFVVAHGFTGNRRQPRVQRVAEMLRPFGSVITFDFRGHGRSTGRCSVGNTEVNDVSAAVAWGREMEFPFVSTVGFSMGGAVVLRQAALQEGTPFGVDAVASVSAPAFWYYRGTAVMRWVHGLVMTEPGRRLMQMRGIRIDGTPWPDPAPLSPVDAVRSMKRTPTLIVHGDQDRYFPLEHPRALINAGDPSRTTGLLVPDFGHAEEAIDAKTLHSIGRWVVEQG
jgi:pimeloyl-ACP methyl ester carboxylesterase